MGWSPKTFWEESTSLDVFKSINFYIKSKGSEVQDSSIIENDLKAFEEMKKRFPESPKARKARRTVFKKKLEALKRKSNG